MLRHLTILVLAVCICRLWAIKLGAFNIQTFGQSKASKPEVMEILGSILRRYDVVLIQEIRDKAGTAILKLLEEVNSESSHTYEMIISERLGRTSYMEQYAFFYRKGTGIEVVDSYHFDDGDEAMGNDTFMREPFVVLFHLGSSDVGDVVLIPLHTSPDFAVDEINALVDVHRDAVDRWGVEDVIILGDLNADCNYVRASHWPDIILRTDEQYVWKVADDVDTTVSATDCAYDRIILVGERLVGLSGMGIGDSYRFEDPYSLSTEEALAVSDHYPVEIELP